MSRGRKTQELLAVWLNSNTPLKGVKAREASLPGQDIYDPRGYHLDWAIEVKATEAESFTGALRQAKKNADSDQLPVVVYRPRGYGEERIKEWLCIVSLETLGELMYAYDRGVL